MTRPLDQTHASAMSFGDHLEELRTRVMWAVALPIPVAIIALPFTDTLIEVLMLPLFRALASNNLPQAVQALGPAEIVLTQIKLCILVACIVGAPWMLWQAWLFISPGLYHHERRFVNLLVPGSAILTVAGVLLLYYFMLPIMLTVMVGIGANVKLHTAPVTIEPRVAEAMKLERPILRLSAPPVSPEVGDKWEIYPDSTRAYIAVAKADGGVESATLPAIAPVVITQQFRLSEYINFVLVMALGTVVGFQMPLVVMLLGWIGVATPEFFRRHRRYALFGCAAASAIITPSSDMISMFVMMAPLYALYELGIVLLVLAPASKVAEGRVFALPRFDWLRRFRADKSPAQSARSSPVAPPPHVQPRDAARADQASDSLADGSRQERP